MAWYPPNLPLGGTMKTRKLPYEPISTLRQEVLQYFEDEGEQVTGSILHVGSGPDTFSYGQYFPNAKRYRCLNKWGGLGGGNFPNIDIHADVQNMPEVPDDSEDMIIATFFLFQVEDVEGAFREFYRVLRHGGVFVATFTGEGWKGNPHHHKWTQDQAETFVDNYFNIVYSCERDIGSFVVAICDKRGTR